MNRAFQHSILLSLFTLTACSSGTTQPSGSGGSSNPRGGASGGAAMGGAIASGGSVAKGGASGTGAGGILGAGGITGSGGTGGGGSVTTVGGSETLASLTPAESTQLCKDTSSYFGQNISKATLCKEAGLGYAVSSSAPSDTQLQKNCTTQEATCLQGGPAVANCTDITASCTATVAQYSACITDRVADFNQKVSALAACATVTKADLTAVWDFMSANLPASCTLVTDQCPTLDIPSPLPGTSSSGGSGGGGGNAGSGREREERLVRLVPEAKAEPLELAVWEAPRAPAAAPRGRVERRARVVPRAPVAAPRRRVERVVPEASEAPRGQAARVGPPSPKVLCQVMLPRPRARPSWLPTP
jgi:hypothetical protein